MDKSTVASSSRPVELLSPARTADIGIAAIDAGADAVYIGAPAFGARAQAGNTLDGILRLVEYARPFGVKVYVTLNTILYDSELEKVRQMALQLAEIGVDAFIAQDMSLWQMHLPIPLNASTQMDNRTPQQVQMLYDLGYSRAILARELSLDEIHKIHQAVPKMELEVFVHGALCVSLSGRCYASQYCFSRSANRGECAQFCRLAFDLIDGEERVVVRDKHLLSMRDLNRSHDLEQLMDAGVSSFKIEGRLKDIDYVRNITAYYRQTLDSILQRRPEYRRASYGHCETLFKPDPLKSFNRRFTDYFLHGRKADVWSPDTPKSVGEPVGEVKENRGYTIRVSGLTTFHSGDGLCYFDVQHKLHGFRVNRAEANLLYPATRQPGLSPQTLLYRNHDALFEHQVMQPQPPRTLAVDVILQPTTEGYRLTMSDETGATVSQDYTLDHQEARSGQGERQARELSKLGGTPLRAIHVDTSKTAHLFLPASVLSQWRRQAVEALLSRHHTATQPTLPPRKKVSYPNVRVDYRANVANMMARDFYLEHGAIEVSPAYELEPPSDAILMTCKHCIRFALNACFKRSPSRAHRLVGPLQLALPDGRKFPLEFDCRNCQMLVHAPYSQSQSQSHGS